MKESTKGKIIMILGAAIIGVGLGQLQACTDATVASIENLGKPGLVKKYSGGKLVYAGISTGKIQNESHSDGYYFADKCLDGTLVEVAGDTVITRPEKMPSCEEVRALTGS